MRMNLRQIEAFRAAMEFGSATAAGEVLHVTQPAVSRLLSDLEANVGFQLFERRARGLVPTQDAHVLYEEVKRSFVGLDRISQVATGIREKATGTVRVIALSKYAEGFVASIIGQFLKDNPGIMVELESSGTAGVVEGIASQTYDVGIASATISDVLIKAVMELALQWGVKKEVLAATLVALGTSLPELVIGMTALRKGQYEILVGNVIGADILNVLFVIGVSASAAPLPIPALFLTLHLPVMLIILAWFRIAIFMAVRKGSFTRWHGGPLLAIYVIYLVLNYAMGSGA